MADAGIGESMLIGAALGGGTSALTGGNPLKGALMGGLGGAATGGIGSMLADGTDAAATAGAAGSTGAASAAPSVAGDVSNLGNLPDYTTMPTNPLASAPSVNSMAFNNYNPLAASSAATPAASPDLGFMNYKALTQPGGGVGSWFSGLSGAQQLGLGGAGILGLNAYLRSQTPQNYNPNQGPGYQFNYAGFHPYLAPNFAAGGSVGVGQNTMYPQSQQSSLQFAQPTQLPATAATMQSDVDTLTNPYTGEQTVAHMATGGISNLGSYSDGGRLLKGPGDGVSDDIPASIGGKQPARLADGEFVVPARIVSELGNGSTDAGARALYKMMNRVQANRAKTVGEDKMSIDSKSDKFLPA